jgi:hypothetical protein
MPITMGSSDQLGSSTLTEDGASALTGGLALTQLIGTCRIGRNTQTDTSLGPEDSWAEIASDVPCRLFDARTARETVQDAQLRSMLMFKLQVMLGTDILPADQVEKDGLIYEVIDTDAGTDNAIYLTAFLVRIRTSALDW